MAVLPVHQRCWLQSKRWWWRRRCHHPPLLQHLSTPIDKRSFLQTHFIAVDLETTSLNPADGEIASIGWVEIKQGRIELNTLQHHPVSVKKEVGQSAVYHQLTDTELASAKPIQIVLDCFLNASRSSVLVFHNATLDLSFLNRFFIKQYQAPLVIPIIDTMQLELKQMRQRDQVVQTGDLRLSTCRARYGLPQMPLHNAAVDALATAELWLAIQAHKKLW